MWIDPRQCLRTLTREALVQLVRETRHYSSAWYRNGRHPACQVYNRVLCASCNAAVSFCKLGDVGAPRPTFWCSALCGDPRASAGVTQSGHSVGRGSGVRAMTRHYLRQPFLRQCTNQGSCGCRQPRRKECRVQQPRPRKTCRHHDDQQLSVRWRMGQALRPH